MKNILIVADVYPPEVSSASHLMKELADGLIKQGHKVTVVTSYPRHYLTEESKEKIFETFCQENGVNVIRVKVLPHHKVNFIIRGVAQLLLPVLFFLKAKKFIKTKLDAVIIFSPPLPQTLIGNWIKKRYQAKFILSLFDIFPQNAIDLGILKGWKHKPAVWLFEWMEKKAYREADKITFHSDGGRRFLIDKKGVPPEKITTLYNWVDLGPYQNLSKNLSFRKQWGLENKFIILFGGIMGPAQGLEFAVETAREISDLGDAVFLFVGDGTEKSKIEKKIKDYSLNNVVIKPFVSKEDYHYLVKDADAGLVCLSAKNKTPFIPGKILGYMAAGKPIVAFLNKESDGFEMIKKANCGYASESDNLGEAVKIVRKIYNEKNKLDQLGKNGFKYALDNLTVDATVKKLEKLFTDF